MALFRCEARFEFPAASDLYATTAWGRSFWDRRELWGKDKRTRGQLPSFSLDILVLLAVKQVSRVG